MSVSVDKIQNDKISIIVGVLAALGGLTAFLIYIEKRKHHAVEADILRLDKNIKELQLQKLQKES